MNYNRVVDNAAKKYLTKCGIVRDGSQYVLACPQFCSSDKIRRIRYSKPNKLVDYVTHEIVTVLSNYKVKETRVVFEKYRRHVMDGSHPELKAIDNKYAELSKQQFDRLRPVIQQHFNL